MNNRSEKEPDWINVIILTGSLAGGQKVLFKCSGDYGNNNGFLFFKTMWVCCHESTFALEGIDGVSLSGEEVSLFFHPNVAFDRELTLENGRIKEVSIKSTGSITEECGKYRIVKNVDARISVEAFSIIRQDEIDAPLEATSTLLASFSRPCNLDVAIRAYSDIKSFFKYITYRNNVSFDRIHLFQLDENGSRNSGGLLLFQDSLGPESSQKRKKQIIDYSILGSKTGKLITPIKNGKINFRHLCNSIEDRSSYTPARIIMILAAFEREFSLIYSDKDKRSKAYNEVQNEITSLIAKYANEQKGDRRRYAKETFRQRKAAGTSISFARKIEIALDECSSIMDGIVRFKYLGFKNVKNKDIAARLGDIRNGIAHNKLDVDVQPITLSDLATAEMLLYAMRLKKTGLSNKDCQKAIIKLFGLNIAPPG